MTRNIFVCDACGGDILGVDHVKMNVEIHQSEPDKNNPGIGLARMKKPITRVYHFHNECAVPQMAGVIVFQTVQDDLGAELPNVMPAE